MTSGTYIIRNVHTHKVYVGSAIDLVERKYRHYLHLRHNSHYNNYLQKAWNKYGETTFSFEVLHQVDLDRLIECEQRAIDFYSAADHRYGYNLCPTAGSWLGRRHTPQSIAKQREAKTGKYVGANNPNAKLTLPLAERIRRVYLAGEDTTQLAEHYGISPLSVHDILSYKTWTSDTLSDKERTAIRERAHLALTNAKLDKDKVVEIRERVDMGETQRALAQEFAVSPATICNIVNKKVWKGI